METEEGFQPVFFEPRELRNLVLIDELESLSPVMDMKVHASAWSCSAWCMQLHVDTASWQTSLCYCWCSMDRRLLSRAISLSGDGLRCRWPTC